ncbi:sensor histidine kinase [Paenibacillus sambharensis]|uniref:histidine kinase n=1 Tax=Paenibacillus sambharensis TaxID=1803190 RepID=A0A2W1L3U1_9BACL|nr:sensor histidine kinase [Paenibacillus sambharensis]PZD94016.1 sensor histidine kinase [Paenibacillus sambharensis]
MKLISYLSSSLRLKLLALFVILTAVPLLIVGLVSYHKSYVTVSDHSKAATLLAADQLARNIDVMIEDTERLLELGKSPQVLNFLYSQSETYEDAKSILQTIQLYRDTYNSSDLLNITMVNRYGKGISERKGVFQLDYNPLRNLHFVYLTQYPDVILRIPPGNSTAYDRLDGFAYPDRDVISIISTVKQRITHEVIGFTVIDIDVSSIETFRQQASIGQSGVFDILTQDGTPIFSTGSVDYATLAGQMRQQRDSYIHSVNGTPLFVAYSTSVRTGWKIIGAAPLEEIVAEANSIRRLIIVSVLLSAVFAITLYYFLTQRITLPLQILMNKMRKATQGYLDTKVSLSGKDEIADLGRSFNIMLDNIKTLMEKSIREQEHIKKAELRTLQAQINPHFLYNTLDSIIWMAEAENKQSVIQLVKALSRFFRLSLNKGRDWVSIHTELEHAQSYLIIQQMRYRDILEYEILVDPELRVYPILKMTLQPLVENAIYHGVKNKRGMGKVTILGHLQGSDLLLIVEDNGAGIPARKLEELRASLEQPLGTDDAEDDKEGGFGLLNVHHRIRLYFGPSYGIEISSKEGISTQITIRLPKR